MAFISVPNKVDFIAQEHQILENWKEQNTFQKMRKLHRGKPHWSFIDGPITANNPMGVHHGWGRTYKDLYNRFWTMQGRELRYQNGFDCQGLWVEVEVEKELGFKSKKDIEEYGLAKFVLKCKERVLRFAAVQTEQSIRLGYWMDWNDPEVLKLLADKLIEDPQQMITVDGPNGPVRDSVEQIVGNLGLPALGGSYFTFSNENNFMIWAFLKKCWDKGWIYRGADVMPWCPRCATGITQHEIITDGYVDITHESVTLRFPLKDRDNESLLVWTTTPWTLTSNVAAAVGPELDYVKVKNGEHTLYLAKGALSTLSGDFKIEAELKGKEMEGWQYSGPFDDLEANQQTGGRTDLKELVEGITESAIEAHRVILWDDVEESEGTGIVHIAPGCGAEDLELSKEYGLPIVAPLDEEGFFVPKFGFLTGKNVGESAELVFANLEEKGLLYHVKGYTHRYPTCWRCKTELVFRLVDEWFINMGEKYDKPRNELSPDEKKDSLRYQIMDIVDQIRWIPSFGHARELDWLRNMDDWMISKKRFWGLSLPIWVCDECDSFEIIGSDDELKDRAVEGWETLDGHTPHRPYIDAIKIACSNCGNSIDRIPDVGDPWLDAGIVSFSTLGYRKDHQFWKDWYPAHWISESFPGQFRNWFYSLLAMATVMDNSPPFLENFGYASLHAEDGREMHKSWGNSIEFNSAADKMGVDVMRWLYCAHKPEHNLLFGYERAEETRRRFLIPLWNVYSFFTTYANLDEWVPTDKDFDPDFPEGKTPKSDNPLDRWILARLNHVVARVTTVLERSDAYSAAMSIESFVQDLTNWYVRRSRRRFWKSELDKDKDTAYATLYHVLVKLTRVLSPFIPFVTETMYENLVRNGKDGITGGKSPHQSIHHTAWPEADQAAIDDRLVDQMALARRAASLGLSARSGAGIKVRQPLAKVLVHVKEGQADLDKELVNIVADELNVKKFEFIDDPESLVRYQVLPNNKLLGPKYGALFPRVRDAIQALDPRDVVSKLNSGMDVVIEVDGDKIPLSVDEVIVKTLPAKGMATSGDKLLTVALDTTITADLRSEGLAREVVRRVQAQRKDAGFNIEDRIQIWYQTDEELIRVIETWGDYIKSETLALSMNDSMPPDEAFTQEHKVEGLELKLGVAKT